MTMMRSNGINGSGVRARTGTGARTRYSGQFKAQVVLEVLTGVKTVSEACRAYNLKYESLNRWRNHFLENAHLLFETAQADQEQARTAELERMIGHERSGGEPGVGGGKKSLEFVECSPSEKRALIKMLHQRHNYPVAVALRVLDVSPSSYYYQTRPADEEQEAVRAAVEQLAAEWPTYGYRRIAAQLGRPQERGGCDLRVNRKRVQRLMRQLGLQAHRPERRVRTTNSAHAFPRFSNLVEGLEVARPEQVWVGDITYVRLASEFVYLAVLMDCFTRSIRGWHLGRSLDGELTLTALRRALQHGSPEIHHSDQGVQYAASGYVELLGEVGAAISMAEVGEAWQNGYAERLMRTIKEEEVALSEYIGYNDAYRQIGRFLDEVYQHKRIHSSLGYLTPAEFERSWQDQQARQRQPDQLPFP